MRLATRALLLCLLFAISVGAQGTRVDDVVGGRLSTQELDSKLMGRKMPYHVVLPTNYNDKAANGQRYPVLYLLHGLFGSFSNWVRLTDIVEYSSRYRFIIVTPEGEGGWYSDKLAKDGNRYESYIIKELIPEVDKKYRTLDRRDRRMIAGLSMGGYGAVKFGLKYPDMFFLAGSFSGAIGAATLTEKEIPGAVGKSIDEIFGPPGSAIRQANDTFDIVRRATPETIKQFPFLYLDCGTEDFLFQNNRMFVELLVDKRVPHEYRELPGAHNWEYWNRQVKEFLDVAQSHLGSN
jgi:putative tributyrin esterase